MDTDRARALEAMGAQIVGGASPLQVWPGWAALHPGALPQDFATWVQNATGKKLVDLLDESELDAFRSHLATRPEDAAADMLVDGLDVGP